MSVNDFSKWFLFLVLGKVSASSERVTPVIPPLASFFTSSRPSPSSSSSSLSRGAFLTCSFHPALSNLFLLILCSRITWCQRSSKICPSTEWDSFLLAVGLVPGCSATPGNLLLHFIRCCFPLTLLCSGLYGFLYFLPCLWIGVCSVLLRRQKCLFVCFVCIFCWSFFKI